MKFLPLSGKFAILWRSFDRAQRGALRLQLGGRSTYFHGLGFRARVQREIYLHYLVHRNVDPVLYRDLRTPVLSTETL